MLQNFGDDLLRNFNDSFTGGGMSRDEQAFLAMHYAHASHVFEAGIGSSTLIANHVKVPKVVGVDSYKDWVNHVTSLVSDRYNMHYVDIGPVKAFGAPVSDVPVDEIMAKQWDSYSLSPKTFGSNADVFLVDGRFRVATACTALKIGHSGSHVLVHDFEREKYHVLLDIADETARVGKLVALQRKPDATDEDIDSLWLQHHFDWV